MAIFMVIYHVQNIIEPSILEKLEFNGFYATSVFFLLSGFILTHVYSKRVNSNNFSNSDFIIKRFSALYPLHIFTLLFSILFFYIIFKITNNQFPVEISLQKIPSDSTEDKLYLSVSNLVNYTIEQVLLLQAWDFRFMHWNAASWSISALFFFYLTFSFFIKKIMMTKKILLLITTLWVIYLIPPILFTLLQDFSSNSVGAIHRNPLLRLPEFLLGISFYFFCIKYNKLIKKTQIPLIIIGFLGFVFMGSLVEANPPLWFYVSHNGLFLFFQLALIAGFLNIKINNHKVKIWIEKLGKSSLSIYMLHLPLLSIFFILYRLALVSPKYSSFSDIIQNAKDIKLLPINALIIFLIVIIPLSLFIQEKVFTPLQIKLSNKLIAYKDRKRKDGVTNLERQS